MFSAIRIEPVVSAMDQDAGMMLLWLSGGVFEEFVDAAGDVSFEAAADFSAGLAFGEASGGVGLGFTRRPTVRSGVLKHF